MIKPVFFLGIVRSGTSFVGRLLTSNNDNVYITHESDIIWILYNLYKLKTPLGEIQPCEIDSPQAMGDTIKKSRRFLETFEEHTPFELYEMCQRELMKNGTHWQRETREDTIYLGDKKPTQQSEPEIFKWTEENLPEPKYIHLIRHPQDFLGSTTTFGKTAKLWGDTNKEIIDFWTKTQKNVIEMKKQIPDRVITMKYENICREPKKNLGIIYRFLDVPYNDVDPGGVRGASIHENIKLDFDLSEEFLEVIDELGYEVRQ